MTALETVADGIDVDPREILVVVGIGVDAHSRERLATAVDGLGVLMFAPDLETAHAMLGRQIELERAVDLNEGGVEEPVVRLGDLEVDRLRCQARWRGKPLQLSRRERDLLALFASQPGRAWTHEQLYEAAWDDQYIDAVPVHAAVKRLRRKLVQGAVLLRVESVRGVGYQLLTDCAVDPVTATPLTPDASIG